MKCKAYVVVSKKDDLHVEYSENLMWKRPGKLR